jgi:hypothetical protein
MFHHLQLCNQYLVNAKRKRKSLATKTRYIAHSKLPNLVKYYAYRYLINSYPKKNSIVLSALNSILAERDANVELHAEAEALFLEMRKHFKCLSQQDNQQFAELLRLFADYYENTVSANEAMEWSESLNTNQTWLGTSFSVLYDMCCYAVNYAKEHPIQAVALILFAVGGVVGANAEQTAANKVVEVTQDFSAPGQVKFISTTDKEFKASVHETDDELLAELIRLKVVVDPELDQKSFAEIEPQCEKVKSVITTAIKSDYQHHRHIARVLSDPMFNGVRCVS